MKLLLVGVGIVLTILTVLYFRTRQQGNSVDSHSKLTKPTPVVIQRAAVPNDKLILVNGASHEDIRKVLKDFCRLYSKSPSASFSLRLTNTFEHGYAITTPYDIDFEILCFLINYLQYPTEVRWTTKVAGWTSTNPTDTWITQNTARKRVMLYVPEDDREYDNVYLTTEDNIGYKLGFAVSEEKKALVQPKKVYLESPLKIEELTDKPFEDFM
jgi:Na+-transporting methylmalonyl-CoA/oxaloacetate decarboxylase gamma subunit